MTRQTLNLTGWLAFVYAAIEIPIIVLYVFAQDWAGASAGKLIEASLSIISITLFVYLTLRFKEFLNRRFNFHHIDALLQTLIIGNTAITGVNLLAIAIEPLHSFAIALSVISLVVLGIVGMVFSTRMLRLPNELYGLLKPYSYTHLIGSLLTATVFLVPLGLVAGVINSVVLGMIFFRAAEQS